MARQNESGLTLLIIIAGLVALSTLAAAMSTFFGTSLVTELNDIGYLNAYHLAESGVRYAMLKQSTSNTYLYPLGSSDNKISLTVAPTGTTSTGVYSSSTGFKSTRVVFNKYFRGGNYINASKYVLYAPNADITLKKDATIVGGLDVKSLTVQKDLTLTGSIYSAGNVDITSGTVSGQNICANGNITIESGTTVNANLYATGSITVLGTLNGTKKISNPLDPICNQVVSTPTITPIPSTPDGAVTGTGPGYTLGTDKQDYYFSQIYSNDPKNFSMCIDIRQHDVNIFVKGDINVNAWNIQVITPESNNQCTNVFDSSGNLLISASYAAQIYFETHGAMILNKETYWLGTIYAVNGIQTDFSLTVVGSIATASTAAITKKNIDLTYVQSDYAKYNW